MKLDRQIREAKREAVFKVSVGRISCKQGLRIWYAGATAEMEVQAPQVLHQAGRRPLATSELDRLRFCSAVGTKIELPKNGNFLLAFSLEVKLEISSSHWA